MAKKALGKGKVTGPTAEQPSGVRKKRLTPVAKLAKPKK